MENKKMKGKRSLYEEGVVTPLKGGGDSNMSGKSRHLRCCALKIRTKDNKRRNSLNTLIEFLYFQNSMCNT